MSRALSVLHRGALDFIFYRVIIFGMIDYYGESTVYLSNTGVRLYSYFEYLLDIIATNLSCYVTDFFRNEDGFGCGAIDLQDASSIKTAIENVIKKRVPVSIVVNDVTITEGKALVTLSGSFGVEQVSLVVDDADKKSFRIEKIKGI